jgi:urease accessory protein
MFANALIVAEADVHGGTRLARLRGEPPLLLRQTGPGLVHLVGGAAGPLGGDDLRLDIDVGPDAVLCVRTVAASVALPARSGTPSRVTVTATVARGATLHWLPEQVVATANCHHLAFATVELSEGAALLWRDELICGRHGEAPGDATLGLSVSYAGRPLLRQTLSVGPSSDGWAGPAVLGGAKATGSLLRVGVSSPPAVLGPTAVRMPLAGPGSLITATAPDAHTLRGYLTEALPDGISTSASTPETA